MIADRESVSFVTDLLDQMENGRIPFQDNGIFLSLNENMFFTFSQADERSFFNSYFREGLVSTVKLTFSAVDEY